MFSDEEQFHNAMKNNWCPGQWSLEVKKTRFNPLESSQRLLLLNTHLVASNFSKKLLFLCFQDLQTKCMLTGNTKSTVGSISV